jgi:hypothetical protein
MKQLIAIFVMLLSVSAGYANENPTPCASKVFAENIAAVANQIDTFSPEGEVQAQIYTVFADKDILSNVLK